MAPADTMIPLGSSARNQWRVSGRRVDLVRATASSRPVSFAAEPQDLTLDLCRTALLVIDMQNDFCSPDGWLASIGVDVAPARAPIEPLRTALPALRAHDVPILRVNWGNRPDRLNLSPTLLHVYNPAGSGVGLGDPLPPGGARVLEKDSLSAATVKELPVEAGDIQIDKYRMSGFVDTALDSILRNLGVTSLLFAGVNLDQCVMCTLQDAAGLGYDCILLDDCCATTSPSYCADATRYNVKQCFGFVARSSDILQALERKP